MPCSRTFAFWNTKYICLQTLHSSNVTDRAGVEHQRAGLKPQQAGVEPQRAGKEMGRYHYSRYRYRCLALSIVDTRYHNDRYRYRYSIFFLFTSYNTIFVSRYQKNSFTLEHMVCNIMICYLIHACYKTTILYYLTQ